MLFFLELDGFDQSVESVDWNCFAKDAKRKAGMSNFLGINWLWMGVDMRCSMDCLKLKQ